MNLELLAGLAKLSLYAGTLVGAGTTLAWASLRGDLGPAEQEAPRRIARGAGIAASSSAAGLAVLAMRLGIGFDRSSLAAVLSGSIGAAAGAQILGATLLFVAAGGTNPRRPLRLIGTALLLSSFGMTGHSAAAGLVPGCLAAAHVAGAAWWLGGLFLIGSACSTETGGALAGLVRRFSRQALAVVAAMAGAGIVAAFVLVDPTREGWWTPYARALLVKVALAGAAVAVAAYNRLRLAPKLSAGEAASAVALRRSVTVEIVLIGCVLAATAWLTTFHSPHEGHSAATEWARRGACLAAEAPAQPGAGLLEAAASHARA
ncbi:MAG TPA: CopD family protein [Thermoanaerobaculia bacterium]|nr:CopD family protein [Thermoanaerobaculia bacterium]